MSFRTWDRGSEAIAAALTFALAVALFAWGGHWLDGRLGTSPLFLVLGAVVGLLGGFLHLLQALAPDLLPFGKKGRKGKKDEPRQGPGEDDARGPTP